MCMCVFNKSCMRTHVWTKSRSHKFVYQKNNGQARPCWWYGVTAFNALCLTAIVPSLFIQSGPAITECWRISVQGLPFNLYFTDYFIFSFCHQYHRFWYGIMMLKGDIRTSNPCVKHITMTHFDKHYRQCFSLKLAQSHSRARSLSLK